MATKKAPTGATVAERLPRSDTGVTALLRVGPTAYEHVRRRSGFRLHDCARFFCGGGAAGGVKLLEVRRLATRGHAVTVIGEKQFWRLVESAAQSRKARRVSQR